MKIDRIGLVVVLASLAAATAILYLVFDGQHDQRQKLLRIQASSVARALSGIPYEQLIPGGKQQSVISVLQHGAGGNFAFVNIVDLQGRTINEVVSSGIDLPAAAIPADPSEWLGERRVATPAGGQDIIEFHAPLFAGNEVQGFVRLGYREPSFIPGLGQLSYLAAVTLPVFLLVPLFYLLLRLEFRPIATANAQFARQMEDDSYRQLNVEATGELGEFMRRFNRYVEKAHSRVESLEADQNQLITSTKLLTYRKNRIESVLESLPEPILILDESGAITFANQKFSAMFNTEQDIVLSKPPEHWCDHPDVLQLLSKYSLDGGGRAFTETLRFDMQSVVNRSIAMRTYPLFIGEKRDAAAGTLVVFRDESQEALAKHARTEFVSHLSHELKSPLNVLAMYSETMLTEAGNTEEFRVEAANVISEEVRRLGALVNGLLSMTQIESGSLVPEKGLVKLRDVASAAFEEAKHSAADKNYKFEFEAPAEMDPVFVDKDLLRIAINNLLSNAVKYNVDDGEIRLTIEETDDAIQIRVADSGIGVSEEEAHKVFEKFYRSEDGRVRAVGGHGIGLSLTKQIVELHHGTISLNPDVSRGAEFIVNLWKESSAVKQAI